MTTKKTHNGYSQSNRLLDKALKAIPLGAQTFSKSHQQFPEGQAPLFLSRGKGGRVWDVDGNEYVDLICGLLPVVLGHGDEDVNTAVAEQLVKGVSFSTGTEVEIELAERLIEEIPSAEMVRFGKNGTDATSAAVRLARAYTGRDGVIACGYHGWQDWYIGATVRNKGVPRVVSELTHRASFNELDVLLKIFKENEGEISALIMEPVASVIPKDGYLQEAKELAHRFGALLIFDEIITGFRISLGGAQAYYDVTPDLSAFGKGLGNGLPISALVGRADIMAEMEEVFISGTFGGEALSLAAGVAVIDKMRKEPVIETLWKTGETLAKGTRKRIASRNLENVISLSGLSPWMVFSFHDHELARKEAIKTLFIKEVLTQGVLINASHNICYAHDEEDITTVMKAYDYALDRVAEELATGKLEERLGVAPIMPVFAPRPSFDKTGNGA